MNLSWKNRFLESRDAVVSQFRELSVILEEFSHQIDQARDISEEFDYIIKKHFRKYHIAVGNLLLLEYGNGQKEAFLTARTTNGRCITSKEAAELMGQVVDDSRWSPAKDSRSIITKQYATIRLLEDGGQKSTLISEIYRGQTAEFASESTVKQLQTAITYVKNQMLKGEELSEICLLYTSPSPRDTR